MGEDGTRESKNGEQCPHHKGEQKPEHDPSEGCPADLPELLFSDLNHKSLQDPDRAGQNKPVVDDPVRGLPDEKPEKDDQSLAEPGLAIDFCLFSSRIHHRRSLPSGGR